MKNQAANTRQGRCYQIALAIIEIGSDALILVHGRIAGIEHAWIVADDGRIYDPVAHALIDAAFTQLSPNATIQSVRR